MGANRHSRRQVNVGDIIQDRKSKQTYLVMVKEQDRQLYGLSKRGECVLLKDLFADPNRSFTYAGKATNEKDKNAEISVVLEQVLKNICEKLIIIFGYVVLLAIVYYTLVI